MNLLVFRNKSLHRWTILSSATIITATAFSQTQDVQWFRNTIYTTPATEAQKAPVIGSAVGTSEQGIWEFPRVGIYDLFNGVNQTDKRDDEAATGAAGGKRPWMYGLQVREIISLPSVSDHDQGRYVTGIRGEGKRIWPGPITDTNLQSLTQGIAAIGNVVIPDNEFPTTNPSDLPNPSVINGFGASVQHSDLSKNYEEETGFVKTGYAPVAIAGEFQIWPDNAHFGDETGNYTVPSIKKAWGLRSQYTSGRYKAKTGESTTKRHGAYVDKFRGLEVGALLQADYTRAEAGNNGTHDKLGEYIGIAVAPPMKLINLGVGNDAFTPQQRADRAILSSVGIKLMAPQTGTDANWRSPSNYIGLQADAKANFNAPVNFSSNSPATFDGTVTVNGASTFNGSMTAASINATGITAFSIFSDFIEAYDAYIYGPITAEGNIHSYGNISASNSITAGGSVSANSVASGQYLRSTGIAGSPGTPTNGDIWFNSTQNDFRTRNPVGTLSLVGTIFTLTAQGTASGTTLTNFPMTGIGTRTIPANSFKAGKTVRIRCGGNYFGNSGTVNFAVRFNSSAGNVTLLPTTNIPISPDPLDAAQSWTLNADITCRGTGSSASFAAIGNVAVSDFYNSQYFNASRNWLATVNTTLAQTIEVAAQFNAVGPQAMVQVCTVEILN